MSFNLGDLIQLLAGTGLDIAAPGSPLGLGLMGSGAGGMLGGNSGQALGGILGGATGGVNSLMNGGGSNSIESLLKTLAPLMGGSGNSAPSRPSSPMGGGIGMMQSKPFQPITGQPIGGGAPTGGGSQAQTIQALLALLGMGNSTGGM